MGTGIGRARVRVDEVCCRDVVRRQPGATAVVVCLVIHGGVFQRGVGLRTVFGRMAETDAVADFVRCHLRYETFRPAGAVLPTVVENDLAGENRVERVSVDDPCRVTAAAVAADRQDAAAR